MTSAEGDEGEGDGGGDGGGQRGLAHAVGVAVPDSWVIKYSFFFANCDRNRFLPKFLGVQLQRGADRRGGERRRVLDECSKVGGVDLRNLANLQKLNLAFTYYHQRLFFLVKF